MKNLFVSPKQGLALREIDFDEPCLASWNFYTNELNYNSYPSNFSSEDVIQLPLKQQVFRWFREKYGFDITIQHNKKYVAIAYSSVRNFSIDEYKTYEEAENACIDKLIELAKNSPKT